MKSFFKAKIEHWLIVIDSMKKKEELTKEYIHILEYDMRTWLDIIQHAIEIEEEEREESDPILFIHEN